VSNGIAGLAAAGSSRHLQKIVANSCQRKHKEEERRERYIGGVTALYDRGRDIHWHDDTGRHRRPSAQ
jgi:hypothetical protein